MTTGDDADQHHADALLQIAKRRPGTISPALLADLPIEGIEGEVVRAAKGPFLECRTALFALSSAPSETAAAPSGTSQSAQEG